MHRVLPKNLLTRKFQALSYRSAMVLYLLILVIGSIPGARTDIGQYAPDAVLHSLAYAALTILLFAGSGGDKYGRAIKSVLTVMAMGAFDEYVQSFFPYRTASATDWMVDVIAGVFTTFILWAIWPGFSHSEQAHSAGVKPVNNSPQ